MRKLTSHYKVLFTRPAQKDYEAIRDSKLLRGVNRILQEIKEDPYQFKKLSGPLSHLRSARTFSFRVLYQIESKKLLIWVVSIDNRKDVYRQ